MKNFETAAETKWGTKKVRRGPNFNTTISYKSLRARAIELPIKVAGSVIPFALGNVVGEVIENIPIIDQYTNPNTNMLIGIIAGAVGFAKSGLNLDGSMHLEAITIAPAKLNIK